MKNLIFCLIVTSTLLSCSKNGGGSIPGDHGEASAALNKTFFEEVGEVYPYRPLAENAQKIKDCIYADTNEKSCPISKLPLIGISSGEVTVDKILDRTVISHDFLGETFKQVLLRMPTETLQLFGAVSAVVISDKINPSFYLHTSGAIYLSGRYFWRNYDEWEIVSKVSDSREGSGMPLQFIFDADYIRSGKSIYEREDRNTQSYNEIAIKTSRLLFHELTHANDFFSPSYYKSEELDTSKTYSKDTLERWDAKKMLSHQMPEKVTSTMLTRIGQILYQGEKATTTDSQTTAEEVLTEFLLDTASDNYAYSTDQEDLAMCAEESLMLAYFDAPRFLILLKLPKPYFTPPENYVYQIAGGQKSRVLENRIKEKAFFAIENILNNSSASNVKSRLDHYYTKMIPVGTSWEDLYNL